ncbi:MAG: prephenate dehydrogenase/arogenate dehydrogenase family protein [Rhizobiaceae bacterium]|nr:prephenate dehydrogenase/arogenate dehydrogenase family protein [Rhizobiaceae bacterium]
MAQENDASLPVSSLGIAGAGLIGASIAARAAEAMPGVVLKVFDRSYQNAAHVAGMWSNATVAESLDELKPCDLVFVATPVGAIAETVTALLADEDRRLVVVDTGSVKGSVVEMVKAGSAGHARFVPGHPLAGSHLSGPQAASPELVEGRVFVLTPTGETAPDALALARATLDVLGARVVVTDPTAHDELLALTSHLPHVVAYALMAGLDAREPDEARDRLIAGSFRAQTVFAASDPEMWADILIANADAVERAARDFNGEVERFVRFARAGDKQAIMKRIALIRDMRKAIGD